MQSVTISVSEDSRHFFKGLQLVLVVLQSTRTWAQIGSKLGLLGHHKTENEICRVKSDC